MFNIGGEFFIRCVMKKYKICVYAIAKNEMKFIDRWYNSVKEADYVCVLDTGSTDGSFEKFKSLGIITAQKNYKTFRFDIARNDSMALIPPDTDICVCVDIDEVFVSGWSKILCSSWNDSVGRARYRYTWNFNPDGSEGVVFMADKVHKYGLFKWKYPVHEVLTETTNKTYETISLPNIQLNHLADNLKSRSSYLPLLELSVKENPLDDRNVHYLGREYMFHGDYKLAIKTLKTHLNLPTANWDAERCASLRYIANCYGNMAEINKKNNKSGTHFTKLQEKYYMLAILECPYVREPYYELALFYYNKKQFLKSAYTFNQMFKINDRFLNYMSTPVCWGSLPYDYLSLCYYELKDYKKAITAVTTAINLNKTDERLKNNLEIFKNCLYKTKKI